MYFTFLFQSECSDWIHTAKILLSELIGDSIDDLFPLQAAKSSSDDLTKQIDAPDSKVTFHDHEKLSVSFSVRFSWYVFLCLLILFFSFYPFYLFLSVFLPYLFPFLRKTSFFVKGSQGIVNEIAEA